MPDVAPVMRKTLPAWSGRFFSVMGGGGGRIIAQVCPILEGGLGGWMLNGRRGAMEVEVGAGSGTQITAVEGF